MPLRAGRGGLRVGLGAKFAGKLLSVLFLMLAGSVCLGWCQSIRCGRTAIYLSNASSRHLMRARPIFLPDPDSQVSSFATLSTTN